MSDRYSVFCEEELSGFEVNAYYLTMNGAFKMAKELFNEGKKEVVIMNMEEDDE